MPLEFTKKSRINIGWIVLLSVVGLLVISILPIVTYKQTDSIAYSFSLLEKTTISQLIELKNNIQLVIYCFWLALIFALLSFIGLIIFVTRKNIKFGLSLMLFGCATILFNILIVVFQIIFLIKAESFENILLTSIGPLPIKYLYITLAIGLGSLIISSLYIWTAAPFLIKNLKPEKTEETEKKEKKTKKKKEEKSEKNKEEVKEPETKEEEIEKTNEEEITSEETPTNIKSAQKKEEIEDWIKGEIDKTEKEEQVQEPEKKQTIDEPVKEEKPYVSPFGKKTTTEPEKIKVEEKKPKEKEEQVPTSKSFEKALHSAIEKRQTETTLTSSSKEKTEIKPAVKELKVRCPECKNVFSVKKEGTITKIKCPKCGKEGIAK